MAYGKNKGLAKGGKKGQKKKQIDPFMRKIWYKIKAPTYFKSDRPFCGRTMVTKTAGTRTETEGLKGRICEFNLADLQKDEQGHKCIKLEIQEIQGKNCLTDFHGLRYTRDKLQYLIKKKHTLVEAQADCKTADGYVIRMFCIAFTKKMQEQVSQFCYAQSAHQKKIRATIVNYLQGVVAQQQLKDVVQGLISDTLEDELKKRTHRIFPLDPLHIFKVKMIKKPKLDVVKLMEIHEKGDADTGVAATEDDGAAKNLLAA